MSVEYEPLNDESGKAGELDDAAFDELFDAKVAELAALESHHYDRKRKGAAQELGISVKVLDTAVRTARGEFEDDSENDWLSPPDPWDTPVNGAELLADMTAELNKYLSMQKWTPETVALWCLSTYVYDLFWCAPYLSVQSPTPACGKSTLLTAVGLLSCKSVLASNITPAALFRIVQKLKPTLLLDEADQFVTDDKSDLKSILNCGHSKNSAFVFRCEGDSHELTRFSVFSPKALASIGSLPPTVQSRSIVVHMRRKRADEITQRFREP